MLTEPTTAFLDALEADFPGLTAPAPASMLEEPRGVYNGQAAALLRPRSTAEMAEIARRANAASIGLIPYSGGTGLVGGQIREEGPAALLVSLERMNAIRAIDPEDRTMVVEAGVILADVQAAAEAENLLFPLSLASEGSARIGGNLSTNAGGVNVIRYGNARDLCLGIEAVLADGTVIEGLKSLKKDNTGYDLRHLMIGAEGTLGIITAARLKLVDRPIERITALLSVPDPTAALVLLRQMQSTFAETISAFELIDRAGVGFIEETMPQHPLPPVGDDKWMVLIEVGAGAGAGLDPRFETAMETAMEDGLVTDGHVAQSEAQRNVIWGMRETIPEANRLVGAIMSNDISVPIARVPAFIEDGEKVVAALGHDLRINCFGHLGDGNLHYNLYPPKGRDKADFVNMRPVVKKAILDLVQDYDGSISAEHGIGRMKKAELALYGDPGKLVAMRAIKAALDPNGIMNPGAVIDV